MVKHTILDYLGLSGCKSRFQELLKKFRNYKIDHNEYVCLKYLILLNPGKSLLQPLYAPMKSKNFSGAEPTNIAQDTALMLYRSLIPLIDLRDVTCNRKFENSLFKIQKRQNSLVSFSCWHKGWPILRCITA